MHGIRLELVALPWLRSWKVLFTLVPVYLAGMLTFAIVSVSQRDQDQGDAAGFAAMARVAVGLIASLVVLVRTVLLKRDSAKPFV